MSVSLPAQDLAPRTEPGHLKLAAFNAASRVGLPVVAKIPERVKRLLLGRRSVTVDGNTLDTTVQLVLTMQRLAGTGGLVSSTDLVSARAQLDKVAALMPGGIAVPVRDFTIPGPAGVLAVRHYRAAVGAPLLVFFHGGGFVLGDIESHDRRRKAGVRGGLAHRRDRQIRPGDRASTDHRARAA